MEMERRLKTKMTENYQFLDPTYFVIWHFMKKSSVIFENNQWRYTWRLKMKRIYSLSLVLKELNNMSHNDESETVTQK